jgi:hypothetical protein
VEDLEASAVSFPVTNVTFSRCRVWKTDEAGAEETGWIDHRRNLALIVRV